MSSFSAHRTVTLLSWLSLFLGLLVGTDRLVRAADPTDVGSPVLDLSFEDSFRAEQLVGAAELAASGPTSESFVGLPAQNRALELKQAGAHLRISDDRPDQSLDFTNGDTITIEAWVKLDRIAQGLMFISLAKGGLMNRLLWRIRTTPCD